MPPKPSPRSSLQTGSVAFLSKKVEPQNPLAITRSRPASPSALTSRQPNPTMPLGRSPPNRNPPPLHRRPGLRQKTVPLIRTATLALPATLTTTNASHNHPTRPSFRGHHTDHKTHLIPCPHHLPPVPPSSPQRSTCSTHGTCA